MELVRGKLSDICFPEAKLLITDLFYSVLCQLEHQFSLQTLACSFLCWEETGNCLLGWQLSEGHLPVWHLFDLLSLYLDFSEIGKKHTYVAFSYGKKKKKQQTKMYSLLLFFQNCKPRCLLLQEVRPIIANPTYNSLTCWDFTCRINVSGMTDQLCRNTGTAESLCCAGSWCLLCCAAQWEISRLCCQEWYRVTEQQSLVGQGHLAPK